VQSGNQHQHEVRDSSQSALVYEANLVTLQDLLRALELESPGTELNLPMLRSTARRLSRYLSKPENEIRIELLPYVRADFASDLHKRHYRPASVRSYANYASILEKMAKKLGFTPEPMGFVASWENVLEHMPTGRKCHDIASYAISQEKKPLDFSDEDLKRWFEVRLAAGRGRTSLMVQKAFFRRQVFQRGLSAHFPLLSPPKSPNYAVPFQDLPEPMKSELDSLWRWKTEPISVGRPKNARVRLISAQYLRSFICQIAGYVLKITGEKATSLRELLTKERITNFLVWCINERKVTSGPLSTKIGMLWAAVREFPLLSNHDLSWLPTLTSLLPKDSETARDEAKNRKWVQYDTLCLVPEKIRAEATQKFARQASTSARSIALAVRDELLMLWLVILPWRQRNLRECKIRSRDQGGNIFKEEIPPFSTVAKPKWVEEALQKNPHDKFWQFYFREDETKTDHVVHCLAPKQLIPLLEEYLGQHRPALIKGSDPGFLFLNSEGRQLKANRMDDLVESLALRHAGRCVNPHLFRDIFAKTWLDEHPEDYLTVSKILWHRNIQTTLRIYGRKFDESHGVRRVELWFEERGKRRNAI
jgi:Phage integrase family